MRRNSNPKFKHIVITGASSGIGEALALHYAAAGVRISMTGRNNDRLQNVANACRTRGAEIEALAISVTDREGMKGWLERIDIVQPVDLLIANAGISGGTGGGGVMSGEEPSQVRGLFDVNVTGVFNTIEPLLPRMTARRYGHVVLVSSIAGFRGWPGAPAYCATKAAIRVYGEGLRGVLARTGVKVHVICPGFVRSRMTDANDFPMPLIVSADRAARIIANGIARNKGRIAFPLPVYFSMWLLTVMPDWLAGKILKQMPAKRAILKQ